MSILHTFLSPRRYAQGAGALAEAGTLIQPLGEHAFVLYDRAIAGLWVRQIRPALAAACLGVRGAEFAGECTQKEIDRVRTAARVMQADVLVGFGGGKTIDTARAVADDLGTALATVPTLAATGAPMSALSAIDTDAGLFDHYRFCRHNPDLVLVDTQVIADARTVLYRGDRDRPRDVVRGARDGRIVRDDDGWRLADDRGGRVGAGLLGHAPTP